jgi:hypothetical protein
MNIGVGTHFPYPRRAKLAETGACVPMKPRLSAKNVSGDFDKFKDFARRIMTVPRSAIQAELDADRERKRTAKASASRASGASPKRAT